MNYQIDQSGKIEDTARDTILCLSNDGWYAVVTLKKTEVLGTEERLSLRSKRSGSASTRSKQSIAHEDKKSRWN